MHAVFFGLKRAWQSSLEWMKSVFVVYGLTPARFDMMVAIDADHGGICTQKALRGWLGVSGATISRMLKSLRELGLVDSERTLEDRRCNIVNLTRRGRALLREVIEDVLGSGLGGLAVSSTIDRTWEIPRITAPAIHELLVRTGHLRRNFGDCARLAYGSGPDH